MIYGPKRGVAFATFLPLVTAGAADWKAAPTIAAGDFQVKKDAGGFANLATLPALDGAGQKVVRISLSAAEMDAGIVVVRAVDQTNPKEWEDTGLVIHTTADGIGDKTGMKLAADGLDVVTAAEPAAGAVPGTFKEKVVWLVHRFLKTKLTKTGAGAGELQVLRADDGVITRQAIGDDGTEQTVGGPTA